MQLTVMLFASYAEALGHDHVDVTVPAEASVSDLVLALRDAPGGAALPLRPLVAVNRRHAGYDQLLAPNDEVAVIPPVAGG